MKLTDEEILDRCGWSLDCQSPLNISHTDGTMATNYAAQVMIDYLRDEFEEEREDFVEALKPRDIIEDLENIIPGFVVEAVNNLLKKNYRGSSTTIKQADIQNEILRISPEEITQQSIYDNKWMDFDEIFKKKGWDVEYIKSDYTGGFKSYFTFTPKK